MEVRRPNPLYDVVHLEVDQEEKATKDLGNGVKLHINTEFNRYNRVHLQQKALVKKVPKVAHNMIDDRTAPVPIVIKPGDYVYVHHHVKDHKTEDGITLMPYNKMFCRERDGKKTMINGWNFVEPMTISNETESGILTETEEETKTTRWGILKYKDPEFNQAEEGDKVVIRDDCDYKVEVDGEVLYRVRTRDLIMSYE